MESWLTVGLLSVEEKDHFRVITDSAALPGTS